jgi:hypothetical protein
LVGLGVTVNTNSWLAVHPSFNLVCSTNSIQAVAFAALYVSPEQMVTGVETLVGLGVTVVPSWLAVHPSFNLVYVPLTV